MRFVLDDGTVERELVARAEDPTTTVADLLAAAGVQSPPTTVTIDGRAVATDHTVAEAVVPDGATIAIGRAPARPVAVPASPARLRLDVVAGTVAGGSVPLDRALVVGSDLDADLRLPSATVSARHCRVVVDGHRGCAVVTDLGSAHGTWVDGARVPDGATVALRPGAVLRCGAVALLVVEVGADDRPRALDGARHGTTAGTVPFNRPPRPAPPAATPEVTTLGDPPAPGERPRFPLAAVVAPAVVGLLMVVLLGDPRYALFVLLTPVMMLASTVGERRRSTRQERRAAADHRLEVERFVEELTRAAAAETRRRWRSTPSIAESCRRGRGPSVRLWERRPGDDDALVLTAGIGGVPFRPCLVDRDGRPVPPGRLAGEVLDTAERLPDAPVPVDLSDGGVVGIAGDRTAALALARSLVTQAAVHHGPADLRVVAAVSAEATASWSWLPWLPHTAGPDPDADRWLAVGPKAAGALLRRLQADGRVRRERPHAAGVTGRDAAPGTAPTTLLVLDLAAALQGRDAPARAVLRGDAGPVAGIVVAPTTEELPAVCDTVVVCGSADGDAVLVRPARGLRVDDLLVAGLPTHEARLVARRLAGLEDPELPADGGRLPSRVDLLELLEVGAAGAPSAAAVAARWDASADSVGLATPIGVGPDGTVVVDLVEHGPHGLLAGTTGSGKSELLRSLVAGLAANHGPDHLAMVLVDYKGGAAFDVCAELPHVVGVVTDLDEHLGERALRSLEAELAHRERRLRRAGVQDLPAWRRLPAVERGEPLPRLLVVVDEFATLRAELPSFVESLVGIAQRGRSLGVHLLLATQRPAGAVDEDVRANTTLRIALRVTDRLDSTDVVGVPDAAAVPPSLPGRGMLRIGPGAARAVQTALVSGRRGAPAAGPPVTVEPLRFAPARVPAKAAAGVLSPPVQPAGGADGTAGGAAEDGPTDLALLVSACRRAAALRGPGPPRRPWLPPLPTDLDLDSVLAVAPPSAELVPLGLVDLPDEQAQRPVGWDVRRGPLLLHGAVGSGTTTAATTGVLAAAARCSPDDLHVQVLDLGRGDLAPLAALPHVGSVVVAREEERRHRLLRWLLAEGARRARLSAVELAREPLLLVVVDGWEQLAAELDDPAGYEQLDALQRLVLDSPGLRTAWLLTTTRATGLRPSLAAGVEQRWALRLAGVEDIGALGLRPAQVPDLPPGGAVRAGDGALLQLARAIDVPGAVGTIADRWPAPSRPAASIGTLPVRVGVDRLHGAVSTPPVGPWSLPVGVDADDLALAALRLHRGEHALVLGPPGAGRSGLLAALGRAAMHAGTRVVAMAGGDGSPLLEGCVPVTDPSTLGRLLVDGAEGAERDAPLLVLVDDAEHVPDPGVALDAPAPGARVHLVCAARPDGVQADYGHWLRRVARARVGVVLRPSPDGAAGDLLGVRLPRRAPARVTPGRGWLVTPDGVRFVQAASGCDVG